MIFRGLRLQNFFSIQSAEITFAPGVFLVVGINHDMSSSGKESNGAGKSAILEAIPYAIYGSLRDGVKADAVVNKTAGKNCLVELAFSHNGHEYVLRRTRKHDEFGNGLQWWYDGQERTSHRDKDSDADLISTLNLPEEIFRHTIQVGQGMPDKFLALSESAKRDLLCSIIDLTLYDQAESKVGIRIREFDHQLQYLTSLQQKAVSDVQQWTVQIETCGSSIASITSNQITESGLADHLKEMERLLAATQQELDDAQTAAHGYAQSLRDINAQMQSVRAEREPHVESSRKCQFELQAIDTRLREIQSKPDRCPTCGQSVDISHLNAEAEKLRAQREPADNRLQSCLSSVRIYDTALITLDKKVREDQAAQMASNERIRVCTASLSKLQRSREELLAAKDKRDKQIAHLQAQVNILQQMITQAQSGQIEREQQLQECQTQLDHYKFWQVNLPNLRASAFSGVLDYVNDRLREYMDILSEGSMNVALYQEAYGKGSKIKVELQTAGESYGGSSGGERRRVDLAIYLALADITAMSSGVQSNLLICDEIMDNLSPHGALKFLEILRRKADAGMCVLAVTHNSEVSKGFDFDTIYKVEKRGDLATVSVTS